jgi:hypothetical protein
MENESGVEREYAQFFALPGWLSAETVEEAKGKVDALVNAGHRLIVENPERSLLATFNPDRPNISIRMAASPELTFANQMSSHGEHITFETSQLEMLQETAKVMKDDGRFNPKRWLDSLLRPVSVRWTAPGNQAVVMTLASRPEHEDILAAPFAGDLQHYEKTQGTGGVVGSAVVTRNGTPVWFQTGPEKVNALTAGPARAKAEALLALRKNGWISGIVLGAEALSIGGKEYKLPTADAEFALSADGRFHAQPILRPIDTVVISPQQHVFTDRLEISFDIPTQDTDDIEYRYTLDGSDPTLESTLYAGPFFIDRTVRLKVRPFRSTLLTTGRKGLKETPWNVPGVKAGKTMSAIFTKVAYKPALELDGLEPGLDYDYLESDWPELFMNAGHEGVIPVLSNGQVSSLLNPEDVSAIRKTDMAYAIRYNGYLTVPEDGVYTFTAPEHLFVTSRDAGYDLRLWVADEEWFPQPYVHAENTWSVPLKKGTHRFKLSFADYRYGTFKNEYWMPGPEEQLWQGIPVLEVSGPNLKKQPLPNSWLSRAAE